MASSFKKSSNRPVVLGVCGASGQLYARWILKILIEHTDRTIHLIVSETARGIIRDELGLQTLWEGLPAERLVPEEDRMENRLASGSYATEGMIVCPCSLNTLAGVSAGMSDNLLRRAAQVHLKQRRKLVMAVREMPVGTIDLENMLKLSQAGAIVTPISPPFYHRPKSVDDLAEFTAQKIVELLFDFDGRFEYQPGNP